VEKTLARQKLEPDRNKGSGITHRSDPQYYQGHFLSEGSPNTNQKPAGQGHPLCLAQMG
jgi:hypothetical protein